VSASELLVRQEKLQADARAFLAAHQVERRLAQAGRVLLIGSYVTGGSRPEDDRGTPPTPATDEPLRRAFLPVLGPPRAPLLAPIGCGQVQGTPARRSLRPSSRRTRRSRGCSMDEHLPRV
jgi:hypothetical protein